MQQTLSKPSPNSPPNNGGTRAQTITITAITLFAISGLLIGFIVGAANRPKPAEETGGPVQKPSPVVHQQTPTPTPQIKKQPLGCPIVDQFVTSGKADGNIVHTLKAHAVDKSAPCLQGKPIEAPGITCKLWLSKIPKENGGKVDIGTSWKKIETLKQPMPGEIENGLLFDPATPQTQPCNSKGQATWKFGIAPQVKQGTYYIVVLTDWDGTFANWSWYNFTVQKTGEGN
jgi:hypothetical protein